MMGRRGSHGAERGGHPPPAVEEEEEEWEWEEEEEEDRSRRMVAEFDSVDDDDNAERDAIALRLRYSDVTCKEELNHEARCKAINAVVTQQARVKELAMCAIKQEIDDISSDSD